MNRINVLKKEALLSSPIPSALWGYSKKTAIYDQEVIPHQTPNLLVL